MQTEHSDWSFVYQVFHWPNSISWFCDSSGMKLVTLIERGTHKCLVSLGLTLPLCSPVWWSVSPVPTLACLRLSDHQTRLNPVPFQSQASPQGGFTLKPPLAIYEGTCPTFLSLSMLSLPLVGQSPPQFQEKILLMIKPGSTKFYDGQWLSLRYLGHLNPCMWEVKELKILGLLKEECWTIAIFHLWYAWMDETTCLDGPSSSQGYSWFAALWSSWGLSLVLSHILDLWPLG